MYIHCVTKGNIAPGGEQSLLTSAYMLQCEIGAFKINFISTLALYGSQLLPKGSQNNLTDNLSINKKAISKLTLTLNYYTLRVGDTFLYQSKGTFISQDFCEFFCLIQQL